MKHKYLTAEAMTRGEHMRSSVKDNYERNWPDDTEPFSVNQFDLSLSLRERFAVAARSVNSGHLPTKHRRKG